MAQAKITLLGMYGYFHNMGEDLFELLVLPEGMEKDTFTDTLFLDYGERGVLYTNPDLLKRMIGAWSNKWALELARIAKTLLDDYEPLWNIDRYEKVTDNTADEATETNESTTDATTENKTSAYNSSSYEPDNHSKFDSGTKDEKSNEFNREYLHDGHYYGNGGVTSSQSLVTEEMKLREQYNLYHEACKLFADDLLLYIY